MIIENTTIELFKILLLIFEQLYFLVLIPPLGPLGHQLVIELLHLLDMHFKVLLRLLRQLANHFFLYFLHLPTNLLLVLDLSLFNDPL